MCGAETVGAGVAAADDDDVLAGRRDRRVAGLIGNLVAFYQPVGQRKGVHREVHAAELSPGHRQVTRRRCTTGKYDDVVTLAQLLGRDVDADVDGGPELRTLVAHLLQSQLEVAL